MPSLSTNPLRDQSHRKTRLHLQKSALLKMLPIRIPRNRTRNKSLWMISLSSRSIISTWNVPHSQNLKRTLCSSLISTNPLRTKNQGSWRTENQLGGLDSNRWSRWQKTKGSLHTLRDLRIHQSTNSWNLLAHEKGPAQGVNPAVANPLSLSICPKAVSKRALNSTTNPQTKTNKSNSQSWTLMSPYSTKRKDRGSRNSHPICFKINMKTLSHSLSRIEDNFKTIKLSWKTASKRSTHPMGWVKWCTRAPRISKENTLISKILNPE